MSSNYLLYRIGSILGLAALAGVFLLTSCQTSPQPEEAAQQATACEVPANVNTSDEVNNSMITGTAIPPIDTLVPEKIETATFALGWFWGPDSRFGSTPGVVRTRVGYSGGTTKNPDYEHIGDHAESVQVEYDPTRISYAEILDIFWRSHDPTAEPYSSQYASIIFYGNEEQRRLAEETKAREEAKRKHVIYTRILPATEFYQAEDYHQKFYLRLQDDLMREFSAMYPDSADFVRSTAAARVNGYVHGQGMRETLKKEIDSYGLSPAAKEKLHALFISSGP